MDSEPKKIWLFRLQNWAVTLLAVLIAANAVSGITYASPDRLLIAAVLLSLAYEFVRPLLLVLALPLLLLTLTLFRFVINAFLLGVVAALVPGFEIHGFWAAFWGALTISVITTLLHPRAPRPVAPPNEPFRARSKPRVEPNRYDKDDPGNGPIIDV